MPKVAGTYVATVTITKELTRTKAESKEEAVRKLLLLLAADEGQKQFKEWVNGGMKIELVAR